MPYRVTRPDGKRRPTCGDNMSIAHIVNKQLPLQRVKDGPWEVFYNNVKLRAIDTLEKIRTGVPVQQQSTLEVRNQKGDVLHELTVVFF